MLSKKLNSFFNPSSIAVIGASANPMKIGGVIVRMLSEKFKGEIYPVNPKYSKVFDLKCYSNLRELPRTPELIVVAIPAKLVPSIVEDAGKMGVEAAIIISGGFSEIGEKGRILEDKLKRVVEKTGIRIIGPNCIGVYDAYSGVDTFFLPEHRLRRPPKGKISIISQSGAFVGAILDWASKEKIGISKAISFGNKIDVDEIELIEYLADDPLTDIILLYLEGFKQGRGREFIKKAREASLKKPILVLKGGKTLTGSRAVISHTGALAGSYELYRAAFKQAKIIEAEGFEELFDMARALQSMPYSKGSRVLVLTNAGGMGVMAADALEKLGLKIPEIPDHIQHELRKHLPPYCITKNPIDLTGDVDDERYRVVLETVMKEDVVDVVLAIVLMQVPRLTERITDVLRNSLKYGKPIIACMVGGKFTEVIVKKMEAEGIPVYPSPERAARAVWALCTYGKWRGVKIK